MTAEPVPASLPADPGVRLITVSASYGAGGSVVAPALAKRLGLPFLQRVTTSEGHIAEPEPCDEQLTAEEVKATPVHRLLAHFTQAMPTGPTQSPPSTHHQDEHLRGHGEAGIHRLLAAVGGGVILGGRRRSCSVRTAASTSGWTARPTAASPRAPRSKASAGGSRAAAARGRQSPHRLRPPPVPVRSGRPGPVPLGDRLHRDTPGYGHRANRHHRPRPRGTHPRSAARLTRARWSVGPEWLRLVSEAGRHAGRRS